MALGVYFRASSELARNQIVYSAGSVLYSVIVSVVGSNLERILENDRRGILGRIQ
jgi:hypothetical protein